MRSGAVWSATFAPTRREPELYRATFLPELASFRRRDAEIESLLEIAVSPEDDVEVRRLTLTNLSDLDARDRGDERRRDRRSREPQDDVAHPAFGKLFLETEAVPLDSALICARRPRAAGEKPVFAVHVLAVAARPQGPLEWETDRARFFGRGRDASDPEAMENRALSGTTGTVLDPILSLRQRVRLAPGAIARLTFTTGVADTREAALALARKYHDPSAGGARFRARADACAGRGPASRPDAGGGAPVREARLEGRRPGSHARRASATCTRRTRSTCRRSGATGSRATCLS